MSETVCNQERRWTWIAAIGLLSAVVLPAVADGYLLRIFTVFYIYLLLAIGLAVIVNYAGLLNLGFVAFFGIGAYTFAIFNKTAGWPFYAALPVGILLGGVFGFLVGIPTLRVRGDYLALVTLAFGEIARIVFTNVWGPHGIAGISAPIEIPKLGSAGASYLLALLPIPFALGGMVNLDRSILARKWMALRDNEEAAVSCGINPFRTLLVAVVIGTACAGLAGVVFAGVQRYVSPASFVLEESILVLSITVLAGGRSLPKLIGATALLTFLPELLRDFADYRMLAYGLLLSGYVVAEERIRLRRLPGFGELGNSQFGSCDVEQASDSPGDRVQTKVSGTETRLQVVGLTKRFGGLCAVDEVTIDLRFKPSIIGLIGPNGAGKSTLFNCIAGSTSANAGKILLDGLPPRHTAWQAARAGIGRTFQTPQLFPSMTVQQHVDVGGIHRVHGTLQVDSEEILKFCGLQNVADAMPASLPLGTQRMVELARALAMRPRLLLLDEIASGLAAAEKRNLADLIRRIVTDLHISCLVVEHDMDFILPLAERIVVLDAGRVLADGASAEVARNQKVIDAYLGTHHAAA